MEQSVLLSVKKMLGISAEYTEFDADIILHINAALMVLEQMGVGTEGFAINDAYATWDEFVGDEELGAVQTYVYLKARMMFDPPQSSVVAESYNQLISEFEWRLNVAVDPED